MRALSHLFYELDVVSNFVTHVIISLMQQKMEDSGTNNESLQRTLILSAIISRMPRRQPPTQARSNDGNMDLRERLVAEAKER